jgi:DNA-binding CsgD family transcriptional regulator
VPVAGTGVAESSSETARLVEREQELGVLEETLLSASEGRGRLVLVEGAGGIGKSHLLRAAAERAERAGLTVLTVAGLELERDFSFGLAQRLLAPATRLAASDDDILSGSAGTARPLFEGRVAGDVGSGADHGRGLVVGLRQTVANLTTAIGRGSGPGALLLAVDDAQWSDPPSLRFLAHLAAGLDSLPVSIVVAARIDTPAAPVDLLEGLKAVPGALVLRPEELTEGGVATMVRATFPDAASEFERACAHASGGNPFYLTALLQSAVDEGMAPGAAAASGVESLVPKSVVRSVLVRLARLPEPAPSLAAAVAVLGDGTPLRQAANLAGLAAEEAESSADALSAAHILGPGDPLGFSHPLIAAAVYADLPALARSRAHRSAADLLATEDAPPEALAAHFLACRPDGDATVVAVLRAAGERAAGRGDFPASRRFLERALLEPPTRAQRGPLEVELALTLAALGTDDAVDRVTEAIESAQPGERARICRTLARLLVSRSEFDKAAAAIDQAMAETEPDHPTLPKLLTESLVITGLGPSPRPAAVSALNELIAGAKEGGELPEEPGLCAQVAVGMMAAGMPAEDVARAALVALEGLPIDDGLFGMLIGSAVIPLIGIDELDPALRATEALLESAGHSGALIPTGTACHWRAMIRLHQGDLEGAVADSHRTLEVAGAGWDLCAGWVAPILAQAHLERSDLSAAQDAISVSMGLDDRRPEHAFALLARGRLQLARGHPLGALSDFQEAGARGDGLGIGQPTLLPWRGWASLAALELGQRALAVELSGVELEMAREIGAARVLGCALSAAGVARGGVEGRALLAESCEVLEDSPSVLERARALVTFGSFLRRGGDRVAGREPLRHGFELAESLGASAIADHARAELHAAGGRRSSRSRAAEGTLTAAEMRVAELAASGLSSAEIARRIYVTPKTVDWHLGHIYRKLGINSRRQLGDALADAGSA